LGELNLENKTERPTAVWQKWRFHAPQSASWRRLIKHWFSASIPIAIGMLKFATFAKPQNVCDLNQANRKVGKNAVKQMEGTKSSPILCGVRANRMADKLGESK